MNEKNDIKQAIKERIENANKGIFIEEDDNKISLHIFGLSSMQAVALLETIKIRVINNDILV